MYTSFIRPNITKAMCIYFHWSRFNVELFLRQKLLYTRPIINVFKTGYRNVLLRPMHHADKRSVLFYPEYIINWCDIIAIIPIRWHHNGRDGVSNHQPHDCLLNRLFGRRSKKTSKLRVTGLCVGNSPGIGKFPAQMASNSENVSIWWRHHVHLNAHWQIFTLQSLWWRPPSDKQHMVFFNVCLLVV